MFNPKSTACDLGAAHSIKIAKAIYGEEKIIQVSFQD